MYLLEKVRVCLLAAEEGRVCSAPGRMQCSESEQMFLLIKNSNQQAHLFELIMADVFSEEIMKVLRSSQLLAECLLWSYLVNTLD